MKVNIIDSKTIDNKSFFHCWSDQFNSHLHYDFERYTYDDNVVNFGVLCCLPQIIHVFVVHSDIRTRNGRNFKITS